MSATQSGGVACIWKKSNFSSAASSFLENTAWVGKQRLPRSALSTFLSFQEAGVATVRYDSTFVATDSSFWRNTAEVQIAVPRATNIIFLKPSPLIRSFSAQRSGFLLLFVYISAGELVVRGERRSGTCRRHNLTQWRHVPPIASLGLWRSGLNL